MVSDASTTTRMTGAEAIVASLEALGVTDVFGMPGGAILPTYDPLMASTAIRHILVRHEQGAGHAAEGYALATGKVGCALVTSGPGATNVLTALGDACMDSVPIVVISGQVGASLIGTDAFQEADVVGASMPITKHSFLVTDPQDIPARLAEAFHLAGTGRPGPVLVDVTKSAQVAEMDFSWPPALDLPGYKVADRPNMKQVRAAARAIVEAQAPVLYVGGGVVRGAGVVNEGVVKVEQDCANTRWVGCCHDHGAYPAEYMLSPAPQLSTPRGTVNLYTTRQGHRLTNGVPGTRARCP